MTDVLANRADNDDGAHHMCPQCGSPYVNVEHPLKPGVTMQTVCKCDVVNVWLGDNRYLTTKLPPRTDENTADRARIIVEAVRDHGNGTMVPFGYESLIAAVSQIVKDRDTWKALAAARQERLERQTFAGETDRMAIERDRADRARGTADHRALVIADLQRKVATAREVIDGLLAPCQDGADVALARDNACKFLEDTRK